MAKLNVTIPAVSVEINGEKYRKVERDVREGDVIKITETDVSHIEEGGFYAVDYVDGAGDPQITDEDGDEYDAGSDSFEVYEKVAEESAEQFREIKRLAKVGERIKIVNAWSGNEKYKNGDVLTVDRVNDEDPEDVYVSSVGRPGNSDGIIYPREYVVLEPIADKEKEPERLGVGEYVKVAHNGGGHDYEIGSIVKISQVTGFEDDLLFTAEKLDGTRGNWLAPEQVVHATPEEVAAATKPKPTFAVGEHVRILVDTEDLPKGAIAKITEVDADDEAYPYRTELLDGSDYDWYKAEQLSKVTEEEIVQEAERARWAKIGRKVDEFKCGDIVEVTDGCGGHKNGTIGICDGISHGNHCYVLANGSRFSGGAKLIIPVEQRFDRVS